MTAWLSAWAGFDVLLLILYALYWRRRRDLAARIYVHKGAIWFIWLTTWCFFLAYLISRPSVDLLAPVADSPGSLARSIFALLGVLLAIYLCYLILIYPFFASLRPAFSKESLGIDWQLDIYVEDKVSALVEENPLTPLLLLDMGLAEALKETPEEEHPALLKSLWLQYVPVVTGRRAVGAAYLPDGEQDLGDPDLNRTIRLAAETWKIMDNREEADRGQNVLALPLVAGGRALVIFAAFWPRRKPFRDVFVLIAMQFCIFRRQYILSAEVPAERLAYYNDPWLDESEGGHAVERRHQSD